MRITLPDLGQAVTLRPIAASQGVTRAGDKRAVDGRVNVTPGVYVVSAAPTVDQNSLPQYVGALRFGEFHPPPPDTVPVQVVNESAAVQSTARPVQFVARVVDATPPTDVRLVVRGVGAGFFRWLPMHATSGYEYRAEISTDSLPAGRYEYGIVVSRRDSVTTFPSGVHARPGDWNFRGDAFWPLAVVTPSTALPLFEPLADVPRLAFTRIGDSGRRGIFRTVTSPRSGAAALHLELPVFNGRGLRDYTASLVIRDRMSARRTDLARARGIRVRLRGVGPRQQVHVTLVEEDGTSWSTALSVDSSWAEHTIPLDSLRVGRAVLLPQGFPGDWNYWVGPASGRGSPADHVRIEHVERLQLSLRAEDGVTLSPGTYGVEVESILLTFD